VWRRSGGCEWEKPAVTVVLMFAPASSEVAGGGAIGCARSSKQVAFTYTAPHHVAATEVTFTGVPKVLPSCFIRDTELEPSVRCCRRLLVTGLQSLTPFRMPVLASVRIAEAASAACHLFRRFCLREPHLSCCRLCSRRVTCSSMHNHNIDIIT
jgi:hypothetical protein